jgi:methanogenic corrinoid protein MtbC1
LNPAIALRRIVIGNSRVGFNVLIQPNPFLAELLDTAAAGYGSFAARLLIEKRPALKAGGNQALPNWRAHLTQKVLELSTALALGRPAIFTDRVIWAGRSFQARGLPLEDLAMGLRCLQEVIAEKASAPSPDAVMAILAAGIEALSQPLETEAGLDGDDPHQRLALIYLQHVLEGNAREATRMIVAAADEHSVEDIYLRVLMPAQAEVGRLWHTGELTIAEEHFVTATTERVMAVLSNSVATERSIDATVVAAAVAGNVHELGIRSVADFFEMAGWHTVHLGADVPPDEIARAAQYFAADVVTLSVTMATQIKVLKDSIAAVRRAAPDARIIVGGVAMAELPDLWSETGADAFAPNASDAVKLAESLLQ